MPRRNSALDALRKLEADREVLAARQRELKKEAALELGQAILGSGLEHFSKKGLRRAAEALGAMGEQSALEHCAAGDEAGDATGALVTDKADRRSVCGDIVIIAERRQVGQRRSVRDRCYDYVTVFFSPS